MAFGNWDEVVRVYEETFLHTRYAEHAKGILELIPHITAKKQLMDLLPGTTLASLFLKRPDKSTRILIWYEGNDKYEICLYHPHRGTLETVVVETQSVIDTVINFSNKLSELD